MNSQIEGKNRVPGKMKTLLFTLEYPPFRGGIANYYEKLVKYWPGDPLVVLHDNDHKLINDKRSFLKWLPAISELLRVIKREHIDYVIVGHILPLGTATLILSMFTKIRYAVILHGMDFGMVLHASRKKWLAKIILNRAEKIICGNSYTAKLVSKFRCSDDKIFVVNPGIDPVASAEELVKRELKNRFSLDNKIILLTVGRLVKRKGVDKVIESMPLVLSHVPNIFYVIIGDGPDSEMLSQQINNYLLKKNAVIIKNADNIERNAWYDLCDIFIMPARNEDGDFEGFGIVYLEAGVHEKPVIAGDSGGVRDAVEDNLNGLLVDPNDTGAIARAIVGLAQDQTLRSQLGKQGRERAVQRFLWPKQVEKIYKILNY